MKKSKMAVWDALQIAVKRREAKSKGERERYTHLNAEFQRPRSDIRPGTRRAGAGAGSGDAGESGEGPGRGRPAQKQGCWRWMDTPLSLLCALCLWPGRAGQCPSQAHKQNPWAQGECPLPEMPALLIRFLSITLYAPLCPGGAAHPSLL